MLLLLLLLLLCFSSCLRAVSDLMFLDKTDSSVKLLDIFPSFNSSTLIQQFIPLISFPSYFDQLYNALSDLETRSKSIGLSLTPIKRRPYDQHQVEDPPKDVTSVVSLLLEQYHVLLPIIDQEGIGLLMLYIKPLFEHPITSFEAVMTLFEPVSSFIGQRLVQQSFLIPLLNVFDNFSNPIHRYNLFNRNFGNSLISNFGLAIFLSRFLNCFVEAVIEPMGHKLNPILTKKPSLYDDNLLKGSNGSDNSRSLSHRMDLSHASNPLSLTNTTNTKHSLTYNWRDGQGINTDDEDSDVEDFSFPDVSLFETKNIPTSSVFGLLADMEETNALFGHSENDSTTSSPLTKTESDTIQPQIKSRDCDSEFLLTGILPPVPIQPALSLPVEPDTTQSVTGNDYQPTNRLQASLRTLPNKEKATLIEEPVTEVGIPDEEEREEVFDEGEREVSNEEERRVVPIEGERVEVPDEGERVEVPDEGERGEVPSETMAVDPQLLAMSQYISEVASDCLVWLLWRLGPLLSTKHIINPLLDNLHR